MQQFPQLEYPYPVKTIKLSNDLSMAYADEGKGDVILFIHGLASYIPAWIKNIDYLKTKFRCIAIDLPGYGKSSAGTHDGTVGFYSETVKEFIQALDLKDVILAGHSMGGHISLYTAYKYPQLVKKIILAAPAGLEKFTDKEIEQLEGINTAEAFAASNEEKIRWSFKANFFQLPEDAEFMIKDRIDIINYPNFQDYCKVVTRSLKGVIEEPAFDILDKITQPVLLLFGKNDRFVPSYFHKDDTIELLTKRTTEKLKSSFLHVIDNCGHFVQWEKSELVNTLIEEFAKKKTI